MHAYVHSDHIKKLLIIFICLFYSSLTSWINFFDFVTLDFIESYLYIKKLQSGSTNSIKLELNMYKMYSQTNGLRGDAKVFTLLNILAIY